MDVLGFFANNFVILFILASLSIILFISAHISKSIRFYTRIAILLLFLSCILYNAELYTQYHDGYIVLRAILTASKYTVYPLALYALIMVTVPEKRIIPKKYMYFLLIPMGIVVPLFYTSEWTHWVCYFTNNSYHSGPLAKLPYVIFAFYIVVFVVQNFISLKNYSRKNRLISLFISLGSVVGVIIYKVYGKTDDFTPIFAASLILYFLFLYIHLSSIDSLTGLMNRQSYYQDIRITGDKIIGVVSADLNELKYLNDTFGHSEGDEALTTIAKIFINNKHSYTTIYRIGGDEFIIFYYKGEEAEIVSDIEILRKEINEASLSCSFGYAIRSNSSERIEDVIKKADQEMYIDKANIKEKIKEEGGILHERQ